MGDDDDSDDDSDDGGDNDDDDDRVREWGKKGENIIRMTNLFQIHTFHGLIHPSDHIRHTSRHLTHGDGRLDSTTDGIDPRR